MRFNDEYVTNILSGKKTASIRSNVKGLKVGSIIPFTASGRRFAMAKINEIRPIRFSELNDDDAKRDGFETLNELREGLSQFYKKLKPDSRLFAVRFQVVEKLNQPKVPRRLSPRPPSGPRSRLDADEQSQRRR